MFPRATGRLGQHIKPFIFTTIYKRALIKKDKGVVNQEQGDLVPIKLKEPEQDNSGAKKSHFFLEIKEAKPETPASIPTPTK